MSITDPAAPARDEHGLRTQLTRFIISGVIAAVVDFGVTAALLNLAGWSDFAGKTGGWVLGTLTAYLINARWTFRAAPTAARTAAVAVLYLATYATQTGIFVVLRPALSEAGWALGAAQAGAFVVAQGVATVINFVVQRTVIFRVR